MLGYLQLGKAPGPDGILVEFCSVYQDFQAPRLSFLLAQFTSMDSLPGSMSEAIVVLVPKQN